MYNWTEDIEGILLFPLNYGIYQPKLSCKEKHNSWDHQKIDDKNC